MDNAGDQVLGDWELLALGHARPSFRRPLEDLLLFDRRLARMVRYANEPALAQIRLAWWREELGRATPGHGKPPDPLLASMQDSWATEVPALQRLVDGWESHLSAVDEEPASPEGLSDAKAGAFAALARLANDGERAADAAKHGKVWGLAELAMFDGPHRTAVLEEGLLLADELPRLPRSLRALALIGGLSRRSLRRGGEAFLGDRFSPFAAMRLGIFGT